MEQDKAPVVFQNAEKSKTSGMLKTFCIFEHKKIRRIWRILDLECE